MIVDNLKALAFDVSIDEIYNTMDMIKPYLQRIITDLEDMGIGLAINSDGGTVVLYEQDKGVIYEHHLTVDGNFDAYGHEVKHSTAEIEEYHAEIDRRFDQMMGAEQWSGFVGVIQ